MTIQPYPIPSPREDPFSIDLSVRLSAPNGGWIELNDHVVFTVADGSFADEQVTHRRAEDTNVFLEGAYLINALRGNVTRPLNVYVEGQTHFDMWDNLDRLKALVEQRQFQLARVVENAGRLFTCFASDYSTTCDRPLMFARKALLKVQLVTHPVDQAYEEI
jgi:hypothetical protein